MNPWESALISPTLPLREAIAALNQGGLQIAVIVDEERRILGTLTDGDIRRALLRQVNLEAPVADVMARQPRIAAADSTKEALLRLMERHQLLQVPAPYFPLWAH